MTTPVVLHRPEGSATVYLHTFAGNERDARAFAARADGKANFTRLCDPIAISDVSSIVALTAVMMRPADKPDYSEYLRGLPLVEALWWAIENDSDGTYFFQLRERYRTEHQS